MNKYNTEKEKYEPLEQRKARAIWENRVFQLYTHIFHSGCAMVAANIKWHNGDYDDDRYKKQMVNQLRSITYNIIELHTGKRPEKVEDKIG